jgi:hypothetical protein
LYRNRLRGRWEAKEPVHLVGWTIKGSYTEKKQDFIRMLLVNNVTKEERECWVHEDIVPMEVTQRDWK